MSVHVILHKPFVFLFLQDDDAEQVAAKISVQNQLEARMKEALKRRIQEEITKRRVHR